MKAITLWQPWASLMALGLKQIETRSWATAHRGPLLIHAAASIPRPAREILALDAALRVALHQQSGKDGGPRWRPEHLEDLDAHPRGCLLGLVYVYDCVPTEKLAKHPTRPVSNTERTFGDFEPGRFGWFTRNHITFDEPIYAKGHQQLWTYRGTLPEGVKAKG